MVIKPLDNWVNYFSKLELCLSDISSWMSTNMLKLNQDKTELIILTQKHLKASVPNLQLKVGNNVISTVSCVKNLGVYFDQHLTMERQVSAIVKFGHFHISNIGRIRSFITKTACKTLVNSLVTSRLDYGNNLLNGINKTTMNRLQKVQNTAARLITRTRKHEHITPILADLHWLPVQYRPQYKILTYVYCALNGIGPCLHSRTSQFTSAKPISAFNLYKTTYRVKSEDEDVR
ncbi:unnamed protein product [Mytilus coruscus]|uniref:Reverse transcriptase domain-containing protein n=1 Tax=Mytilus coruscus TaxID=42192 RepID=A0A6J8DTK6_MYTCO|nr:unnamed protein product [Mytilus coruscus]